MSNINDQIKCLILGGGGFIGSHLAEELITKGYSVRIFEINNFKKQNISHLKDSIEIFEGDFNNKADINESLKDIDYVFHLISSTVPSISMDNPTYDIQSNLIPTINLLQQCVNLKKIKKLVFISSGGTVYGIPKQIPINEDQPSEPICSYGIIKRTIEHYCLLYQNLYGLDCKIFRLSNPYGERQNPYAKQGVISVFLNKILLDKEIEIWGDGSVIRDYIYIKDVTKLLANVLEVETLNPIYNIGSNKGLSLNELIAIMEKVTNKKAIKKYLPNRTYDVPVNILDNTLAKKDFSWQPTINIENGISLMMTHLLNLRKK